MNSLKITCFLLFFASKTNAQVDSFTASLGKPFPCKTDTIKGFVFYKAHEGQEVSADNGYYIVKCGAIAFAMGDGATGSPYVTFVPSVLQREYYLHGKKYEFTQEAPGRFVDSRFKPIPTKRVYAFVKFETDIPKSF